jgi:hypothetical protein
MTIVMYCDEHQSFLPPSNEDAPGHPFYRCYEWWIAEHVPEAPALTPCEWYRWTVTEEAKV